VVEVEEAKMVNPTLTVPEYAKYSNSTGAKVRTLCESGIIPAYKTDGGQWRILVKGDSVPREVHERALEEIAYLKAKLKSLKAVLESI